jgi:hypothetical protein
LNSCWKIQKKGFGLKKQWDLEKHTGKWFGVPICITNNTGSFMCTPGWCDQIITTGPFDPDDMRKSLI